MAGSAVRPCKIRDSVDASSLRPVLLWAAATKARPESGRGFIAVMAAVAHGTGRERAWSLPVIFDVAVG